MKAVVWRYDDEGWQERKVIERLSDAHATAGDLVLTYDGGVGHDEYAVFPKGEWSSITMFPGEDI